jgi:PAS domain S-box-containing protein
VKRRRVKTAAQTRPSKRATPKGGDGPIIARRRNPLILQKQTVVLTHKLATAPKAEQQLEHSSVQLAVLVQSIKDYAIYMLDRDGRIISWNSGAERIKGYTHNEIMNHNFSRFYTESDRKSGLPTQALRHAAAYGKFEGEGWRVRKDGSQFWASVVINPIHNDSGMLIGYAKVTRDVTERHQAQNLLEQKNKELEAFASVLKRERDNKLMNVQAITATIAHEVRQPLAAIAANGSAALRFLAKTPLELEEVRAALKRLISDTHRTSEVFDGIRALFGEGNQKRKQVDVNEIIFGVIQSSRKELRDHDIDARLELASKLPPVEGHRRQLEAVIANLVHNAIEAMDATTDRDRVLRVRTRPSGQDVITVAVQDSGPGIDPKRIDGIFGAFFTTKSHGMGLGLAICRTIIEHHGGQLTATSDGKTGSLFQFALPIKSIDETAWTSFRHF